jgi:RimJ/RimL family protein N-acetyltransferase
MMQLRPLGPDELDRFVAAGARPDRAAEIREYVERMIAGGAMRPERCYLAEEAGSVVGRVAFWSLPGRTDSLDLVLFDAPWAAPESRIADAILGAILAEARNLGAEKVGHVIDLPPVPPQWQDAPERRAASLEHAGFVRLRETRRFSWDGQTIANPGPERLTYRSIEETGDEAVVAAMSMISEGSLDQRDQEERARLGAEGAARDFLADLRALRSEPGWWELAYDAAGAVVGLVMPTLIPAGGTIGYIGVTPDQRGRGYVHELLARGMTKLQAAGVTGIRADTDVRNAPMAAAFRRAGWVEFATRREYQRVLSAES